MSPKNCPTRVRPHACDRKLSRRAVFIACMWAWRIYKIEIIKQGGGNTKYQAPSTLLHDRISAHGVMYVLPQECAVRLSSTFLLKDMVFH